MTRSLSLIVFVSLFVGCSRGATPGAHADATPSADADGDADADADEDADADTDARAPALLSPIRFHLRNDGPGDVYLGLRFIDRCAFDYTVTSGGAADAGPSSIITEPPSCPCRPGCSDCSTCAPASCNELCDDTPPRIAPGQERLLTWDGRRFDFVALCAGTRCAAASPAAPGRYELAIPVFDSALQEATGAAPARRANLSFDLEGASVDGTDVELSIRLP